VHLSVIRPHRTVDHSDSQSFWVITQLFPV
jgi:hypothetical protein